MLQLLIADDALPAFVRLFDYMGLDVSTVTLSQGQVAVVRAKPGSWSDLSARAATSPSAHPASESSRKEEG